MCTSISCISRPPGVRLNPRTIFAGLAFLLFSGGTPSEATGGPTGDQYCGPGSFSSVCCPGFNQDGQTATPLADGRVLIVGSYAPTASLSVPHAQIYDPVLSRLLGAGQPTTAYDFHTATLLLDGRVLVTGKPLGENLYGNGKAELYDPVADTFAALSASFPALVGHSAAALPGGKVLLAGGVSYAGTHPVTTANARLFDPGTATITATGAMGNPRARFAAISLADGRVLVLGGMNASPGPEIGALSGAEIYDPTTGTFTTTGSMAHRRASPAAVRLSSGKVLVLGGENEQGADLPSAEIFDPATGTFSLTGFMSTGRTGATATLIAGGQVLVVGGDANAASGTEIYDPATGEFCAGAPLRWGRKGHSAASLPGDGVLIVGGAMESCAEAYGTGAASCGPPPIVTFTNVQSLSPTQAEPLRLNSPAEALVEVSTSQPTAPRKRTCLLAHAEGACHPHVEIAECDYLSGIRLVFQTGSLPGSCRLRLVVRDAACAIGIGSTEIRVQ